jgi:hypothetical protein
MAISYYAVRLGPVDCFMLDSNPQAEVDEKAAALIADQRQFGTVQLKFFGHFFKRSHQ